MRSTHILLLCLIAAALALPASADIANVYTIGSNPAGEALDPAGNNVGGIPVITWTNNVASAGLATLSIIAEGIDNNGPGGLAEIDAVKFNGVFIGDLTPQGFYSNFFNLCVATAITGPCGLNSATGAPITGLSTSNFTVNALAGANTLEVDVASGNWVDEIDKSTLTSSVPEPSSAAFLGLLTGAVFLVRRRMPKANQ
ncbi:MAG TPA: PEP-CTERM sorting domain-containing protein [Bryobacteraceae bacterium]|jgi:hypothetical protein|nr:PEP-CTERM sorting domain-containing protein [Bryobacteraceae bacterium]